MASRTVMKPTKLIGNISRGSRPATRPANGKPVYIVPDIGDSRPPNHLPYPTVPPQFSARRTCARRVARGRLVRVARVLAETLEQEFDLLGERENPCILLGDPRLLLGDSRMGDRQLGF